MPKINKKHTRIIQRAHPSVFAYNTEQIPLSALPHPLLLEQVLVFWDLEYYLDQFRLRQ